MNSTEFRELLTATEKKLTELLPDVPSQKVAIEQELRELTEQQQGYSISIGNPNLATEARQLLEENLTRSLERSRELRQRLAEIESSATLKEEALSPEVVAGHLAYLSELMDGENAAATNVMLAQHIAAIECNRDGRVIVRSCLLGALADPEQMAVSLRNEDTSENVAPYRRRRTRRAVGTVFDDEDEEFAMNDFAVDPQRYAGLGPGWFTEDALQVPEKLSWAQSHAREVSEFRLANKASMEVTAEYFGKTPKTILEALKFAKKEHEIDAMGKKISLPTRPNWKRENALRVVEFFQQPGATMRAAVEHFGKSDTTLRDAQRLGEARLAEGNGGNDGAAT